MGTIEQAVKRLQELKKAGVDFTPSVARAGAGLEESGEQGLALGKEGVARLVSQTSMERAKPSAVSQSVDLDLEKLMQAGYLVPNAPRSLMLDEFRVIKRPLLANARGKSAAPVQRPNLIFVTSSIASEGKTFVSTNLALSIASEMDKQVLLVEADPSRPTLMSRLGIAPRAGILEKLRDPERDLSQLILRTNIEKLALLPVGTADSQVPELFASTALGELLDEMAARYEDRIVIFDGPPLVPSVEARVLAPRMGQIVMVVQAGRTSPEMVNQALGIIEACPVVMTLLNKFAGPRLAAKYGYYGY